MKKYITEFIGAFFLVLTIALSGNPIAIGFVLTALVYMGGYISGGYYNPAVTLAVLLIKKISPDDATKYMISQVAGGFVAAIAYSMIVGGNFVPSIGSNANTISAILVETLFTFLLASVVLHVGVTDKTKGNDYFGLAIGVTILAAATAGGPISGGVFNPAVAVGPMIFDINHLNVNNLFIYLLGPFLGGYLASVVYKLK